MYCPKCGANQSDEMKFCNLCGSNLSAVRQAVDKGEAGEKFDWNKNWMAEKERKRLKRELERQRLMTPEVKRANEIKSGITTTFAGVGLMIFLYVFMRGLIKSGVIAEHVAEILRHVWIVGVFPFFGGIGLTISGLVVGKKLAPGAASELPSTSETLTGSVQRQALHSADTTEFITPDFSVTEEATKHLRSSGQKR
jgi:hypothetical protein